MTDWDPLNQYDNFTPPVPGWLDPDFPYPAYILTGREPVPSGIPESNPNLPTVRLGRIISQGSVNNTWLVRTVDGWLVDGIFPHFSYEIGDFIYLLVCGQWCTDMGQRSYLPPTPPIPSYPATSL